MNGSERISPYVAQIQNEHRELHHRVDEIGKALARREGCDSLAQCYDLYFRRLTELRKHLVKHLAEEECGGYMEEALSYVPHLASEATDLEREHPVILRTLDCILSRLNQTELTEATWAEVQLEFKRFAQHLLSHEAHENRLLQHGFNVDLGLEVE